MPEEKKEVVAANNVQLCNAQQLQVQLVAELEKGFAQMGTKFDDYGKDCVVNAIAGLLTTCKNQKIDFKSLDPTLLRLQLENVGLTKLNYNAIPAEIYFDLRKNTYKDKETYSIAIKPQGAGNEKLVREFGVNLKELCSAWLVREGDEFTLGSFNGIEQTPPTWIRKSLNKKIIYVVYPAKKQDGTVEYLIADRDSVKANLIAQIRQNALYKFKTKKTNQYGKEYEVVDDKKRDEFYAQLEKDFEGKTLDEVLALPDYADYINPTYTSGGSKEAMILRKMKNNALKNYPREFDKTQTAVKEAVVSMFEDVDETVMEQAKVVKDATVIVDAEIGEKVADENAPQDFDVDNEEPNGGSEELDSALPPEEEKTEPTGDKPNYSSLFGK